jgi:hypothetical protein
MIFNIKISLAYLLFLRHKKERKLLPSLKIPTNTGFLKNRQINPIALNIGRAFKRIQLTSEKRETQSD